MTDTLNIDPCTLEDARRTIKTLLERLLHTQEIAIDRGSKLIALNEEKLSGNTTRPLHGGFTELSG